MIYSWQQNIWEHVTGTERSSSSWLIYGSPDYAPWDFAEHFAHWLLCIQPQPQQACGECSSCRLVHSGNMPDLLICAGDEPTIKIDQIRALDAFTHLRSNQGGRRVAMLYPAENMNINAQNALLKTLEEPPENMHILLVSHCIGKLLPTIRSRTIRLNLEAVDTEAHAQWLSEQDNESAREKDATYEYLKEWFEHNGNTGKLVKRCDSPVLLHCLQEFLSDFLRTDTGNSDEIAKLLEHTQWINELLRTNNLNADIQLQSLLLQARQAATS